MVVIHILISLLKSQTFWTAVAFFSIIVLLRQLRFDAWLKAQEIFTEEKFTEARGEVLKRHKEPESWDSIDKKYKYHVCRKMDELCHLIPYFGLIPYLGMLKAFKVWDDPLGKSWKVLEKFVVKERQNIGWPRKWKAFEHYGKKALRRIEC